MPNESPVVRSQITCRMCTTYYLYIFLLVGWTDEQAALAWRTTFTTENRKPKTTINDLSMYIHIYRLTTNYKRIFWNETILFINIEIRILCRQMFVNGIDDERRKNQPRTWSHLMNMLVVWRVNFHAHAMRRRWPQRLYCGQNIRWVNIIITAKRIPLPPPPSSTPSLSSSPSRKTEDSNVKKNTHVCMSSKWLWYKTDDANAKG